MVAGKTRLTPTPLSDQRDGYCRRNAGYGGQAGGCHLDGSTKEHPVKKMAKFSSMVCVGLVAFVTGAAVPPIPGDPVYDPQKCWDAPPLSGSCYLVGRVCPLLGWCYLPYDGAASCECP